MAVDTLYKKTKYKPIVLLIIDGWGLSPSWGGNAITMSNPKNMNELWRDYPKTILKAFEAVEGGHGKVGNSEIGHASIGCGRMVDQDITEIDQAIKNRNFYSNSNLLEISEYVKSKSSTLHLIGLLSEGAVHSHIDHLFALLEFAKIQKIKNVAVHVITDGRDVNKNSALTYITKLESKITELGFNSPTSDQSVKIVSIIGRYYALDRDENLNRTSVAYELQVKGNGTKVNSPREAITTSYKNGIDSDENIPPFIIDQGNGVTTIKDNDAVIFYNFRADRARQLTRFYTDKNYLKKYFFFRKYPLPKIMFATLASYKLDKNIPIKTIFASSKIESSLARILADHNLTQLHIAESEKYAHISYFFNGGVENIFRGEKRMIISSLKNKDYALNPQMKTKEISSEVIKAIQEKKYDFIVANIASVDMVGHTGNIEAVSAAVQIVDQEISKIVKATLTKGAILMITADHGNAEQMITTTVVDRETRHTLSPVPFILITPNNKKDLIKSALTPTRGYLEQVLRNKNTLADVAPTVLELLEIAKPQDMTGKSLLNELE
ncbi:MAG: hypothetical protein ACD_58C00122G0001 [uncultured bacterium]|nr:MAG: hypothetical protein ACD_58C00122G0001 [uncultured bacterium]